MDYTDIICQRTGLTAREVELVGRCVNGLGFEQVWVPETRTGGQVLGKEKIAGIVRDEAAVVRDDAEQSAKWLKAFKLDPEQPRELDPLAEKLEALSEEQGLVLFYFVLGWWSGLSTVDLSA